VDAGIFPTTLWSDVRGGGAVGKAREAALAALAQRYQAPAEAYLAAALRLPRERAHELFQGFFTWMLASDWLAKAAPERGRFRAFLKVALRNFATDELRRERAAKRGGGARAESLDGEDAPEVCDRTTPTPDEALDRAWRAALVEAAFERTRLDFERRERGLVFAVFRDYYLAAGPEPDYRALAERHGITTTDVSNYLQRTKQAYREHLRALVLDTVADAEDLGEELAWLVSEDGR
jgi:RNA polymerase sigma-70 factor (ECF subfamily)